MDRRGFLSGALGAGTGALLGDRLVEIPGELQMLMSQHTAAQDKVMEAWNALADLMDSVELPEVKVLAGIGSRFVDGEMRRDGTPFYFKDERLLREDAKWHAPKGEHEAWIAQKQQEFAEARQRRAEAEESCGITAAEACAKEAAKTERHALLQLLAYRPATMEEVSERFRYLVGEDGPWRDFVPDCDELEVLFASMIPDAEGRPVA